MPAVNPATVACPANRGSAADLAGLLPATLGSEFDPAASRARAAGALNTPGLADFVATALAQQVVDDPRFLDTKITDAVRLLGLPPASLQPAFDDLAVRAGVSRQAGGVPDRSIASLVRSVPAADRKSVLTDWFNRQGPAVQRLLFGAALGAVALSQGQAGLQRSGFSLTIARQRDGALSFGLVPDKAGQGTAGQLLLGLAVPLGGRSSASSTVRLTTDAQAQVTAGLALALGGRSTLVLGAATGTENTRYSVAYSRGGFTASVMDVQGRINVAASQKVGNVTISGETNGDTGAKVQVSVAKTF